MSRFVVQLVAIAAFAATCSRAAAQMTIQAPTASRETATSESATARAAMPYQGAALAGDPGVASMTLTNPFAPPPSPASPIMPRTAAEVPPLFVPPANPASLVDPAAMAEVEPTPLEGGELIARIDGDAVLAGDLNWQVDHMAATVGVPAEQREQFRQVMLRRQVLQLVDTKLLYADFRRTVPAENLPKVEESLATPFEEIEIPRLMKMFKVDSRADVEAALAKSGSSLKDVQRQFNERTVAMEWLKQKLPKPRPITHDEMLAHYREHADEYAYEAQVRWEELMVRFDRFGGDREKAWQALCGMGNDVWARVQQNPSVRGPLFADVAKAKSQGFTARSGGVYDWETLGARTCEALNQALATLQIGQMSDGLESDQGFHIVRVLDRREAGKVPFTQAQKEIRKTLESEQRSADIDEAMAKMRQTARVWTIFDGDLNGEAVTAMLEQMQAKR